ncbi:MAG TPA: PadR family transcriptional regulator [Thermoanaerobaculia bacterium]|nr:PadR family transcriptional regulator [Thermoanaerobaculia bacterium]
MPTPAALHVLLALASADMHGWAILKEVSASTDGRIRLSAGTLYGLVKRLSDQGLIAESEHRPPAHWDDQRRRYYRLTELGRSVAEAELGRLERVLTVARSTDLRPSEG